MISCSTAVFWNDVRPREERHNPALLLLGQRFPGVFPPTVTELAEFVQTLPGDAQKTGALLEVCALPTGSALVKSK